MCGIIGYIGKRNAFPILRNGLAKLEYRGYDSAGIAILSEELCIQKDVGKLQEIQFEEFEGPIGIAHVRWATHGRVSKENAHPHSDCHNEIVIVHNGIIENYRELKAKLMGKGHVFRSETDSEVVPHLIEEFTAEGFSFEEAVIHALRMLEGSYTILALKRGEQKIAGARKGSRSLTLGISDDGFLPASDVLAFLEWTNKVVYLKSEDVFFADAARGLRIYNLAEDRFVKRPVDRVKCSAEGVERGEFEHLMLKEISEQDETILRALQQDEEVIQGICDKMHHAIGTFFVGCGSSYHACLAGSYMFSKTAKLHVNVALASEFEHYEHFLTDKTLVFAVSQSGETADVLDAVSAAKRRGSTVVGIVNRDGSILARESDSQLFMNSGPEICVLSTKTYTSQVVLMDLLAYALAGKYEEGLKKIGGLYLDIYNLTSRSMRDYLARLARMLRDTRDIYLIGRGAQYATALEAALKIKEVSYIHAEAFAGGEIKHGTLALIEDEVPCIVFVSNGNKNKILSNAEELKSRGGYIIGVSPENEAIFDHWIKVPDAEELNPIIQIIPMQVLAYQLAVYKGLDPDKPRNLAKCVTVT
ncbi:MAG: glutamine--fructose-6-phosphate transaminase (isomerizing) [Methanophagales archaeon ANME-1-THS]|nr:MAG: glutamine--fructose-6-phosphate transaminase (isomerizing) [Methanophagales archaeon ANME-1-THS]